MGPSGSHDAAGGTDQGRFELLFRDHADAVLAFALRRSDRDTAEDVTAETFAVAWRRLAVVPDPALPWLFGVARKILANERRSRGRADALTLRLLRTPSASSDDPANVVEARVVAQAALDRLRPAELEVLELLAWEGLTAAQAADVLGCSRIAVTLRLHRARRRVDRLLNEPLDGSTEGSRETHRKGSERITRAAIIKEADDAR